MKYRLLATLAALPVGLLLLTLPSGSADTPTVNLGPVSGNMVVASGRGFAVHIPAGLVLPAPVVIALHGYGVPPTSWERQSDLSGHADRLGFVSAIAVGVGLSWNTGLCCDPAKQDSVDDDTYIQSIRSTLISAGIAQPSRVYLLGFSNGDMLGLSLECRFPGLYAAEAGSSGDLPPPGSVSCSGAKVLHFHGNQDQTVVVGGGYNSLHNFTSQDITTLPSRMVGASVTLHFADCGHEFPTASGACGYDGVDEAWTFFNS